MKDVAPSGVSVYNCQVCKSVKCDKWGLKHFIIIWKYLGYVAAAAWEICSVIPPKTVCENQSDKNFDPSIEP